MERASKNHFDRISLRDEHTHRYELAASISSGFVVDCACGIGYSSNILINEKSVNAYLGIDPSEDAIEYAKNNYLKDKVKFEKGTLESNSCADQSVDTFLMFETLEHTPTPDVAIANIRRALKPTGLLIGSVPSSEYEDLCEQAYGVNPFHIQRFTKQRIEKLLQTHFETVRLFSAEYVLGTLVQDLNATDEENAEVVKNIENGIEVAGSIIFIAGNTQRVGEALQLLGSSKKFFVSIPKVILDRDEVEPIRTAFRRAEDAVRERDLVIAAQAKMLDERWEIMQSMDQMVRDRDNLIAVQTQSLDELSRVGGKLKALIFATISFVKNSTRN